MKYLLVVFLVCYKN